jgi:CDP-diacylglycerol--glycerol-3-phosphate 3-phosphatidyltransferase
MFDGHWRAPVEKGLAPIGQSLRKAGVTADAITIAGIVMAAAAAVAIGAGELRVGLLLLVLTGVPDALDGAVAKASGTSSFGSPTACSSVGWRGIWPRPTRVAS